MRMRQAKRADTTALAMILGEWIKETDWMPKLHSHVEDRAFIRRLIDEYDVMVVRSWLGPQGFLARDGAWIHALYIRAFSRGRGQGRRLLDVAKSRSPRLELWCFQMNTRARSFYASEGFREVEHTDGAGNDEKLPDVRLVWERVHE